MEAYQSNPAIQPQRHQEDTIDLVALFYLYLGHIWQILACLVLGAVAAFAVTYFLIKPQYTASSKIYILSASNDSVVNLSDLQVGAQLTKDYQELLLSRPLLEEVINNLSLPTSYAQLQNSINITNTSDTRILKITVTTTDPQQSADIANELVDQAIIYLPRIMETDPPNVVEQAIVPTHKSSPSYSKNVIMGGMIFVVLYCAILTIQFLMNDTLVTPDDIERNFGVQPLATIPEGNLGSFNRVASNKKKKKGSKK